MPERCNPRTKPPKRCLEAFGRIGEQLGRMAGKLDAIHEQVTRINGHVGLLFDRTGRQETEIQLLRADVSRVRRGRANWARRVWQMLVGLALVLAGYLLRS